MNMGRRTHSDESITVWGAEARYLDTVVAVAVADAAIGKQRVGKQ